jgi:hypothetical protein
MCGYEIWSLALREKRGLNLFEKRVLRRIFGHNRSEVTGDRNKYLPIMRNIITWTTHEILSG